MAQQIERNQEATVYVGNLDERCTESLIWELMLQAGPVGKDCKKDCLQIEKHFIKIIFFEQIVNVHLPKDRVTQTHQNYGFVEFLTEEDADYAMRVMNQVRLYGKPVRVNKVIVV